MSETASKNIPTWFWFAAGGALIWNLIGVMSYLVDVTMSNEAVAKLPLRNNNCAKQHRLSSPAPMRSLSLPLA